MIDQALIVERDRSRNADSETVHHSQELLQGQREAWIEHGDNMYRLRITSTGKLVLTK